MGINILHSTAGFGCHFPILLKAKNLPVFSLLLSEQLFPDGGDSENSAIPIET